jgi:hypothetical protein
LDFPWETEEYYDNLIKEGHHIEKPELPRLEMSNVLCIRICNLMNSIEGVGFWEVLDILDLKMSNTEIYILFIKLLEIKKIQQEHERKEMDRIKSDGS